MDKEKEKKIQLFEKYTVPRAIINLCIPTVLGMLATVVYNMVDTFFVGQTKDPFQVASIALVAPIFLLLMAVGNIFGLGGGSYIARMLGKRDYDEVLRISSFSFYTCILFSIITSIIMVIFLDPILKLIGTSANTYQHARSYLFYIALGAPAICLSLALSSIIRSEGAAKYSMIGILIGTVTNIILDPIMILYMDMGVKGAAIATVIGNLFSILYYVFYLVKKTSFLTLAFKYFTIKKQILKNVFFVGTPVSMNNVLISISFIVLNNFAAVYGDDVIAGAGIAGRVFSIVIMFFIGVSQGVQPFVSYNYSSKNYRRMNAAIKFSVSFSVIIAVFMTLAGWIFAAQIIALFMNNEDIIKYGVLFLNAYSSISILIPIQFIIGGTFQAMGKPKPAFFIMISRQGLIFFPTLILANHFLGINGIVWAQPMADLGAAILSVTLYIIVYNRMKKKEKQKESHVGLT